MTCQECELALASDESIDVSEHLTACRECRDFAIELRANSEAMLAFAGDALPAVTPIRRSTIWPWAAIAAMLVLGFVAVRSRTPSPQPALVAEVAHAAPISERQVEPPAPLHVHKRAIVKQRKPEILQVKMLTDDPDVVIYWQVSN